MRIKKYDRGKAREYAEKWAYGRNKKYYDFEKIGGDCTNFVSQCIFAGSGKMYYDKLIGWYYNSVSDRSPSWTGVEPLYKFLTGNVRCTDLLEKRLLKERLRLEILFNFLLMGLHLDIIWLLWILVMG